MREMPKTQLDPRIKKVWRINDAIWITLVFIACFIPFLIVACVVPSQTWAFIVVAAVFGAYAVAMVVFLAVLPPIRYARWRFDLTDDYLEIAKGIIWRNRYLIPFIRVQNTDTRQGPILRAFGLSSVTVSTAAGEHVIPGLGSEQADILRDRAAELARIAREDV
ncbi:MAG: PH domain-containing protein [Eggerthellaceae bacterium]